MRMLEQSSRKRILWHFVAYLLALLGVGGSDSWLLGDAVGGRYGVMDIAPWKVCWLCWQHGNGLCCWCQFGWCHPSQQVFAVFSLWSLEALQMFTAQFFQFAWFVACSSIITHIVLQNPMLGRCHATCEWHHCCRHCHCNTYKKRRRQLLSSLLDRVYPEGVLPLLLTMPELLQMLTRNHIMQDLFSRTCCKSR